ncbi:MarR family winged helix-turn-helix transcriptional regulator [Pseudonocardia sp. GCM10023141]|uniref:MarR family winged helix-turn-helix transcriptional regulator n=1 Tax=Pseudonocardia sp. GCM10023141 TaxID=3252653 RepID=UPI003608C41B
MIDESAARMAEQPCFALYGTVNAITRAYRPLLDPLGLTYPQYVVMMLLWEHDEIDLRTLAERARLDPATLTPIVKRLEQKDLLQRMRSTIDERRLVITVTAAGRELQERARTVPDEMVCKVGITPDQAATLQALCTQIVATLAADGAS